MSWSPIAVTTCSGRLTTAEMRAAAITVATTPAAMQMANPYRLAVASVIYQHNTRRAAPEHAVFGKRWFRAGERPVGTAALRIRGPGFRA